VLKWVVRNPLFCENISPAALARIVEQQDGTMLIDEIDTALGPQANKESAETLRGILNSGYHKSGTYVRMVGAGTNMQPANSAPTALKSLPDLATCPRPSPRARSLSAYAAPGPTNARGFGLMAMASQLSNYARSWRSCA